MRPDFFKAFGVALLLSLPVLPSFISDFPFIGDEPGQESRTLVVIGFGILIGVGLLRLRKWAAIYFSVPLFCYGLWLALSSIEPIPFPWNLFYVCEGISLMLPLIVTVRVWSQLSWGGKWFF
jgi:hypothetical protein